MAATTKPVHTVVLDTGAIIRNHPTVSSLIAQSEQILTVPAIVSEIKDAATRSRVETTLKPFLNIRVPSLQSMTVVTDFARRTGDLPVLSKPDLQVIALAYELECERNGGDWRLRRVPGQKGLNGKAPAVSTSVENEDTTRDGPDSVDDQKIDVADQDVVIVESQPHVMDEGNQDEAEQSDDDSDGWITPSNLDKHQAQDADGAVETGLKAASMPQVMQVATITTDYAMQNVILRMNLNLISPDNLRRVSQLKTYILRCHGCFQTTREMDRQFCARCGKPTLTRVACSTLANGQVKLHLKKNMQWNTRGDRYSIPKAVHGTANGRVEGGGKGHWGHELILSEDQKEFSRALEKEKKEKLRDLMDEDFLPELLTGDRRGRNGGRIKVGAGRNVNSRKR